MSNLIGDSEDTTTIFSTTSSPIVFTTTSPTTATMLATTMMTKNFASVCTDGLVPKLVPSTSCSTTLPIVNKAIFSTGSVHAISASISLPVSHEWTDFALLFQSDESIHNFISPDSSLFEHERVDHQRLILMPTVSFPFGVSKSHSIPISGLIKEPDATLNAWLCIDSSDRFEYQCQEEEDPIPLCPSSCWIYDNVTSSCSPLPGSVNYTCGENGMNIQMDECLLPESFQYWSTGGYFRINIKYILSHYYKVIKTIDMWWKQELIVTYLDIF